MNTVASTSGSRPLGPHCRALRRGVIGDAIDGRSREGKFLRRIEAELMAQIGASPSFAQSLLIRRAARAMLQLELLDQKMASGNWTAFDGRVQSGLNNAVRTRPEGTGAEGGSAASSDPQRISEREDHVDSRMILHPAYSAPQAREASPAVPPGAFPWRPGEVVIGRAGGRRPPIVEPAAQPSAGRAS